jgi:hypothetical protein
MKMLLSRSLLVFKIRGRTLKGVSHAIWGGQERCVQVWDAKKLLLMSAEGVRHRLREAR